MSQKSENGFSLLEIIIAFFILIIFLSAFSFLLLANVSAGFDNQERIKAEFLSQEGIEVIKAMAGKDWTILTPGNHDLIFIDNKWELTDTGQAISDSQIKNGLRTIIITDVNQNLKKVESVIDWQGLNNMARSTSLVDYINNPARILPGDWDKPTEDSYYALVSDARSVFHVGDRTYIGTLNFFGSPDFYIFDTSDLSKPRLISTLDLGAHTWATVNSIYVVGQYAFLATTINGREFSVVDISDENNPHDVAYFSTQTLTDATGVYVAGQYAYLTNLYKNNQKQIYIIDISNPLKPDFVSRLDLEDSAYNLTFQNNNIFIASGKDDQELQIIDTTDPENIAINYSFDLPGTNDAYDVYVKDNYAFMVRAKGDSSEFYILDITNKNNIQIISSLALGDNFRTVYYNGQYIMIGGDLEKSQFQVIDINDLSAPKIIGTVDIKGIVYDLVADEQAAYLAVGGGEEAERGLKIIVPAN